jgi:hypothetical protein
MVTNYVDNIRVNSKKNMKIACANEQTYLLELVTY